MTILLQVEQGSEEWHAARIGVITASNASAAIARKGELTEQQAKYVAAIKLGHDKKEALALAGYKAEPRTSAVEVALAGGDPSEPADAAVSEAWRIALERISGEAIGGGFETFATRRGKFLEPEARATYEMRFGEIVQEQGILLTDDRRFGYSTDGSIFGKNAGIEIKCPSTPSIVGGAWHQPDDACLEYIDQIEMGLWLTGWQWIDLCIYCPWLESVGKHLFVQRIWRDEERIERLEAGLLRFMRMVDQFEALLRGGLPLFYERKPAPKVAAPIETKAGAIAEPSF